MFLTNEQKQRHRLQIIVWTVLDYPSTIYSQNKNKNAEKTTGRVLLLYSNIWLFLILYVRRKTKSNRRTKLIRFQSPICYYLLFCTYKVKEQMKRVCLFVWFYGALTQFRYKTWNIWKMCWLLSCFSDASTHKWILSATRQTRVCSFVDCIPSVGVYLTTLVKIQN
jgi:hypothetical protein